MLGLVALGYLFLMLCLTQRQSMRFVLIALGPMSVAVALGAAAWCDRKTVAGAARCWRSCSAALGLEAGLAVARAGTGSAWWRGESRPSRLLARREPTYGVGRWAARNLPATARLIGQDHRGFYIPAALHDGAGPPPPDRPGPPRRVAGEIVARLRESGFTHLMLCPPVPETAVEFDPTLGRLLAPWLAGRTPDLSRGPDRRRRRPPALCDLRARGRPAGIRPRWRSHYDDDRR